MTNWLVDEIFNNLVNGKNNHYLQPYNKAKTILKVCGGFSAKSENGLNSQRYCSQQPSLHLNCLLWFLLSHVGPHVHLLDPLKHVSDPQVPGHHWQCHLPSWEPHACAESCDEVWLAAVLLLASPHNPPFKGRLEGAHYLWSSSVALCVSLGTF